MITNSPFAFAEVQGERDRQEYVYERRFEEGYGANRYNEIEARGALTRMKAAACGAATEEEMKNLDHDYAVLVKLINEKFQSPTAKLL